MCFGQLVFYKSLLRREKKQSVERFDRSPAITLSQPALSGDLKDTQQFDGSHNFFYSQGMPAP